MSSINGDKSRFHRIRKSKLALRERSREIRKKLVAAAAAIAPVEGASVETVRPFRPL
jgi:hypothetical protein